MNLPKLHWIRIPNGDPYPVLICLPNDTPIMAIADLIRAGKIRPVALTRPSRGVPLPEVPVMAETLPGFEAFKGRIGHYIFAGSTVVYADTNILPIRETHAVDEGPKQGDYGKNKLIVERFLFGEAFVIGGDSGRDVLRRLPRSGGQGPDPGLQRRDPLLEHVPGRIHDPGVDVARLGQPEEVGGMRGVVEDVRRGLVDRQCTRVGRGISGLARVDLLGLEAPTRRWIVLFLRHGSHSPSGRFGFPRPGSDRRTRACRADCAAWPGHHPEHPTAVGGLLIDQPGLLIDALDQHEHYKNRRAKSTCN